MGKMIFAAVVLCVGIGGMGVVHAAPPTEKPAATKNSCWGQVASAFARLAPGTFGEHSRASSPFTFGGDAHATPQDDMAAGEDPPFGRKGVANQSRFLEDIGAISAGEPSQGGNGNHAIANTNNTPLAGTEVANCDGPPTP